MRMLHSEMAKRFSDEMNRHHNAIGAILMETGRFGVQKEGGDGVAIATPIMVEEAKRGSGFVFGKTSEKELIGVNASLVRCVRLALEHTTQDFMVFDGLRTKEEQLIHIKNGTSKTMKSKHLDGLAVDLVPWINGKPTWDWTGCYKIAMAMDFAATMLGIDSQIVWGGAWDRRLSDFGGDAAAYAQAVEEYKARHAGPDFIDGPHFEIHP